LQQPLEHFIKALRASEVRVSVAEAIEAHEVVAAVGYSDRQLLKDALSITVAKSEEEKERFDETFELYFARTEFRDPLDEGEDGCDENNMPQFGDGEGAPETGNELADLLLEGDRQEMAAQMEQAGQQVGVGNIRFFTQRGFYARRLLDQMGLRELERLIAELNRGGEGQPEDAIEMAAALEQGRSMLLDEARSYVDRQYELYARAAGEQLRAEFLEQTSLANIERRDFDRMSRIVRRMAKKLAARYMRRHRQARRGQLDIRRTLRVNMANDGVPFHTVWKTKKVDRPKIVAICDVSRSVAAAAQFLLLFLYSLNEVIAQLRSFAFSSNLIEVSHTLEHHEVDEAIPLILKDIGFRPTDYGQALRDLKDEFLDTIDRRTTVIMLGDGRSNYSDPEIEIMRQINERSQRVIWLNPEPESFWGTGDSEMNRYRPFCHVAKTVNTIKGLERVIDDLLRSTTRV
jgi:uncharacterized protein with von Willebrand factor type A (vWA) domain